VSTLRNDPELAAIRKIQDLLATLPADAQSRVLAYVTLRLTRAWAPTMPQQQLDWPVRRSDGDDA